MPALTARTIETLKPGPARKEIPDRYMPNLYLVLQPSGHRSWAVRYRIKGRARKYTIGSHPAVDLKSARDLAARAFKAIAEGRDPGTEKKLARSALPDTVAAIAEQFFVRHCRRINRPRTVEATRQMLGTYVLPRWGRRLIKDITRRDVIDLLEGIVTSGRPIAANRVFTTVRRMFAWAMERDVIVASPCAGVRPPTPELSRDRVLSDAELRDVWIAAGKVGGPYGTLVKLLALTGQRRDEVASMAWTELDLDAGSWSLSATRVKNGKAHIVSLSDPAVAILRSLPRLSDTFVLTSNGRTAATSFSRNKRKLDVLLPAKMAPWRVHDLRRSVATKMADLDVAPHIVEAVLNHASGHKAGTAGVYNRARYEAQKREALDRWGAHVTALVAGA
jgi:integrase